MSSRVPRAGAALASWLVAGAALGQPGVAVDARSSVYADDDRTLVSTSTAAVRAQPVPRATLKGRYLVDVITTASVDVVSAATGRWEETRHEAEGGLGYADGTRTATASYVRSMENDWSSHTFGGGASSDFFQHTLTLGVGGSVVLNEVGRAGDPSFEEELTQIGVTLSSALVASKSDIVSATYSLSHLRGYQASPYRFVAVQHPQSGMTVGHPERHPELRLRHALGLRWNHHAFRDTAIRSFLRGYADDWGVVSGTAALEYAVGFGDFEVAPFARGYLQTGAAFYESVYAEEGRYLSADRELSPFVDGFGGLRLGWRRAFAGAIDELRAEAKGQAFAFRFFDFPRLPSRTGVLAELALGGSF